MKKPMYTLSDELVHTRKLLQHVFGTHAVPSPLEPGKYISAELLGLELLPLPFNYPPFALSLVWHERAHRDAGNLWLRQTMESVCAGL